MNSYTDEGMRLADVAAESRHVCGSPLYNAKAYEDREALRSYLQARDWQPIESAPESVSVLACNALGYVGRAIKQKGRWVHIGRPTHWMPLPAAPQEGIGT